MSGTQADIAIVGGGLAGGLIALALNRHRPDLSLRLIERGEALGGNHRWSWFDSDLSADGCALMAMFAQARWDEGYEVRFPSYRRRLATGYRSLSSADFHDALARELPDDALMLGAEAAALSADKVTLADGTAVGARAVIDCRPFEPSPHLTGGWQVFLGQAWQCEAAHGVSRPVIMDAEPEQHAPYGNGEAYRFVYVLPLGEREVFIEDTYYADEARLDPGLLESRIAAYAREQGWHGSPSHSERGLLPVITGGDFRAYQDSVRIDGVALAGARGGFSHPLTSYTVPIAVDNALAIARMKDLSGPALATRLALRARRHWRRTGFYRMLGRMLFQAAEPGQRRAVFERFYRLPGALVERFYAARSISFDRLRVLVGKPPVSILKAMRAIRTGGEPLAKETKE